MVAYSTPLSVRIRINLGNLRASPLSCASGILFREAQYTGLRVISAQQISHTNLGVSQTSTVLDGTVVTTPEMTQSSFGYWAVDGVRQQDAWGVALRQVSFTIHGADRAAVAHLFAADSDGDGINDGFEHYYFGTLANGAIQPTPVAKHDAPIKTCSWWSDVNLLV